MWLFTKLSMNCKMQNKGCGCPAIKECLGVEERKICIQLRSSFASLLVYSCKKIKIEVHLGTGWLGN